jgi:uncharacterized membrane protein
MTGRGEIARLRLRLEATLGRAPSSAADLEVQADFAKYACVLVSGFFECAIVALVLGYVERRSAPEVASYIERQLKHWTNPNTEKILALLFAFDSVWGAKATAYLVDARKESINSLVAVRHKIAHGESVGTSLYQVKLHYATVLDVVAFLADLMEPN